MRDVEFSPAVVWDAFVDADLVGGWLGEARIDARMGGFYRLDWLGSTSFPAVDAVIVAFHERETLELSTDRHGHISVRLEPFPGGPRGLSTRVTVTVRVAVERAFAPRIESTWSAALEQLDQLLRGHPTDWTPAASGPPRIPRLPRIGRPKGRLT